MIGGSKDFTYKLLITDRKALKHCRALKNNLSTYIKLQKIQIPKIVQSARFLGSLLVHDCLVYP